MLREIGTVDRIPEYIARAKDKDDRLWGSGTGSTATSTRGRR